MNRHDSRYFFEHKLLPEWFFENKDEFIGFLLSDKTILFEMIDDIFTQQKVSNPYKKEDFDVQPSKVTDEVKMLKIIFPEPEEEPLCYCSYIFFDDDLEKISYFCIEKGNEKSDNLPFVCSWTEDHMHLNHGNTTFEEYNDFLRCAELHMKNYNYI